MSTDATSIALRDGISGHGAAAEIDVLRRAPLAPQRARLGAWMSVNAMGLLCVSVIVICSLLIVLAAAERPNIIAQTTRSDFFPGWMAGPFDGLSGLALSTTALEVCFTAAVATMYACYALGLKRIAGLGPRWVIGSILAVQLIFFLSPPLTLTDVFNYINYARMDVVHNLNPYATLPALEPHNDPAFALSNWHDLLSPYGPLFTIIAFAAASLSVAASFWAAKGALALLSLGMLALVWKCARLLDRDPVEAIAFAGLNPIVLIWGLGGDHNDVFMVFFVVLACWLLLRSREARGPAAPAPAPSPPLPAPSLPPAQAPSLPARTSGAGVRSWLMPLAAGEIAAGAALAAAVFVKASGAIVVPVFLAALIKTPRRLVQTIIGGVAGGLLLAAISYLVFGPHVPSDITQGSIVTGLSVPNLLGMALGLGGETAPLREVLSVVLIGAAIACCVLAYRRRELVTPSGWVTMALLLTLAWVLPWYILWALPLAALSGSRRLRLTVLLFGVYLILVWVPLAPDWNGAIGLHPDRTPVGQQHQRIVRQLLN